MVKIVTHAGQAHPDDLMAVALICIKEGVLARDAQIVRVNDCKPDEMPDANFIVDVGKQYDPEKRWFDHHQFPRDAGAECAFTLVAKHYGLARNSLSWIERLAILDSKGPYVWFENTFGRPAKNMSEINLALGPDVFGWFTRIANATHKNSNAFIDGVDVAMDWLRSELDYVKNREANMAHAKANMKLIDMGSFKIAHFEQREMRGVSETCDQAAQVDPTIVVSTKPDDRGSGFSATRWNNSKRVDFFPRKGEKGCIFAHENGFCLKWENDWEGFMDAIKKSVS